jgi:NADPH2:quinone reductase
VRALVCSEFGPPSALAVKEVPDAAPGEREVAIEVQAAGVNYPDALMVQGKYQVRPPLPFVPGMELAGVVAAVGSAVRDLAPGDPVLATSGLGAFAERCVVPVERVLPRPAALAPELGAASIVTYGTVVHALEDRAGLKPGETLLVLGAAGGVGTAAVEVGKRMKARVIAAASSPEKLAVCKEIGADEVVLYGKEDLRERLKALTGGKGVDVVFDPVGGPHAEPAVRSLAWGGRFLVIGFASGEIPKIPLNLALLSERSLVGVYWGDWSLRNRVASTAQLARIAADIVAGALKPAISARVRLEEAPRAMQDLLERRAHGKIVVVP